MACFFFMSAGRLGLVNGPTSDGDCRHPIVKQDGQADVDARRPGPDPSNLPCVGAVGGEDSRLRF